MGAVATFSFPNWIARYPEFAAADPNVVTAYWHEACLYLANDGTGPVNDLNTQNTLLNMATAHIAALAGRISADNASAFAVGRITNAGTGSVSASFEGSPEAGTGQWWKQTQYGASFWALTARYRLGQFVRRKC